MSKRAEEWTALELAELVEEPRIWLCEHVLEVARAMDWKIQDLDHHLPDEPTVEISAAFAMAQHLADTGRLKEGIMITIEVSPVVASWLGFKQFSESNVEPEQLLKNAMAFALQRPDLARQLVQKLETALSS